MSISLADYQFSLFSEKEKLAKLQATSLSCTVSTIMQYLSPVASIASQFGIHQQQYADDTQLDITISKPDSATNLQVLESALSSLSAWFFHNGLALNPGKSQIVTTTFCRTFPVLM